jgi:CO/xanthine dehydrogenase FAD-binding subunit
MPPSPSAFYRPRDLNDALLLLKRGVTPLVPPARFAADAYRQTPAVMDLYNLPLDEVLDVAGTLHLGGLTPLQTLIETPALQTFANGLIVEAARLATGSALRHLTTLGGVMAHTDAALELRLVLDALDARYTIQTAAEARTAEFAHDDQLHPHEIVLEVEIDQYPNTLGALARVARTPADAAIAAAVAVLVPMPKNTYTLRLVVSELDFGFRFDLTAETYAGVLQQILGLIQKSARSRADYRASAEYRQAMAGVLAKRALEMAWKRVGF